MKKQKVGLSAHTCLMCAMSMHQGCVNGEPDNRVKGAVFECRCATERFHGEDR